MRTGEDHDIHCVNHGDCDGVDALLSEKKVAPDLTPVIQSLQKLSVALAKVNAVIPSIVMALEEFGTQYRDSQATGNEVRKDFTDLDWPVSFTVWDSDFYVDRVSLIAEAKVEDTVYTQKMSFSRKMIFDEAFVDQSKLELIEKLKTQISGDKDV